MEILHVELYQMRLRVNKREMYSLHFCSLKGSISVTYGPILKRLRKDRKTKCKKLEIGNKGLIHAETHAWTMCKE